MLIAAQLNSNVMQQAKAEHTYLLCSCPSRSNPSHVHLGIALITRKGLLLWYLYPGAAQGVITVKLVAMSPGQHAEV
jgi:hypothetical protein